MHVGSLLIGALVTFLIFTLPAPKGCGCDQRKRTILAAVGEVVGLVA